MGIKEPQAATRQLPGSPELPGGTSTSRCTPRTLLSANDHWETSLSPLTPLHQLPTQAPRECGEGRLQNLSIHLDTLQGRVP